MIHQLCTDAHLIPAAHISPAALRADRESADSRYFQVQAGRCRCSPNRTPADHMKIVRAAAAGGNKELPIAHLSIVHHRQRWGLTAHDADGHPILQAAGHPAGCGLVRRGAWTHLTAVIVAPRIHLAGRKCRGQQAFSQLIRRRQAILPHTTEWKEMKLLKLKNVFSCLFPATLFPRV